MRCSYCEKEAVVVWWREWRFISLTEKYLAQNLASLGGHSQVPEMMYVCEEHEKRALEIIGKRS